MRGRDALAFLNVFESSEEIAIGCGLLEQFLLGSGGHALFEAFDQVMALAIEEEAHIAHGFRVLLVGGETCDAWAEAAFNVVLQTGARMIAR